MQLFDEITPLRVRAFICMCVLVCLLCRILMGAIACTAMIMRFVMSTRSGNIREMAAQKLNHAAAYAALCVCLNVCYPMRVCVICMLDQYVHRHNIIDEMGKPVCVVFTNTWSCVKLDGEGVCVCGFVCTQTWGIDAMCRVHDDSLSLSLFPSVSLFLSRSLSLVTVDRFNTMV